MSFRNIPPSADAGKSMIRDILDRLSRIESQVLIGPPGPAGAAGPPGGAFGDGSDGDVVFNGLSTVLGVVPVAGVYVLTRDIFCSTIVVTAGTVVRPSGYRIFCTGLLTNAGAIEADGSSVTTAGVAGGAAQPSGYYFNQGTEGGVGGVGGGTPGTDAPNGTSFGGRGGRGGDDGASSGATAGALSAPPATSGGVGQARIFTAAVYGRYASNAAAPSTLKGWGGGTGGGGGGGLLANPGGDGGGGGGVVFVSAKQIANSGRISANGGSGGNGTGTGGGGAGGGGGLVVCFYSSYTGSVPIAGAGSAGAGGTGATPAAAGLVVSELL